MPAWAAYDPPSRIPPYGGTFRPGRPAEPEHSTFPVFLRLDGRPCVVFGGSGLFVEEKVQGLLRAGAQVRLVWQADEADDLIRREGREVKKRLVHVPRTYHHGDLDRVFLAVAERDAPHLQRIEAEATDRQVPLNVVDDTPRCSYILPSIVRHGDLAVAVSTTGMAPTLAVRIRQRLEQEYGLQHQRFLQLAERLRTPLAETVPDFETRRKIWYRLVDSDVLDLLASGQEASAKSRIAEITGVGLGVSNEREAAR